MTASPKVFLHAAVGARVTPHRKLPIFPSFSFLFLWNLSFWGVRERAPVSQAPPGTGPGLAMWWGLRIVSSVLPVRLYVHQNCPGWETRSLNETDSRGRTGRGRSRGGGGMLGGSRVPGPPPLAFLHYSFFPSWTPPHMLCPTRKKGGHVFRCVLSEKSNSSCLSLGVPSASPGSG